MKFHRSLQHFVNLPRFVLLWRLSQAFISPCKFVTSFWEFSKILPSQTSTELFGTLQIFTYYVRSSLTCADHRRHSRIFQDSFTKQLPNLCQSSLTFCETDFKKPSQTISVLYVAYSHIDLGLGLTGISALLFELSQPFPYFCASFPTFMKLHGHS